MIEEKQGLINSIKALRQELEKHNYYYYVKGDPIISDKEYDELLKKLEALEKEFQDNYFNEIDELETDSSPTQTVGSSLTVNQLTKKSHTTPMLSLANSYSEDEISDFHKRVLKMLDKNSDENVDYIAEPKIDGLSISVKYVDGVYKSALTRGDGYTGEDVTKNVAEIESIPKYLKKSVNIEVRGEIVLPKSSFQKINKERLQKGEPLFATARNAASGSLRQLDSAIVKSRGLDCHFYYVMNPHNFSINDQYSALKFIEELGLSSSEMYGLCHNVADIVSFVRKFSETKDDLEYEVDGVVIKVNSFDYWDVIGSTSKNPRWAIAYKYPSKQVVTKILAVKFQVGRTGKVTPVAELEPCNISGSLVQRATLHNMNYIKAKDIRIGDYVFVEKGGEVIPQVIKVIEQRRDMEVKEIDQPSTCPDCGSQLVQEDIYIRCVNIKCPGKNKRALEHFVSRDAMNITGLGPSTLDKFYMLGLIKDIADIYDLDRSKIEQIEGFGEKSIDNLFASIENSKEREYDELIYALGIPHVGTFHAKLLSRITGHIDELIKWVNSENAFERLKEIDGIGPKIAESIVSFFTNIENLDLIDRLKKIGLNFSNKTEFVGGKFSGKSFLLTGKLEHMTREEAKEKIEKQGGQVLLDVTKKLDYLIVGDKPGSKLAKVERLNKQGFKINILNEKGFIEIVG